MSAADYRIRHGELPDDVLPEEKLSRAAYTAGKAIKQAADPAVVPLALASQGAVPVMMLGAASGGALNASTQYLGNRDVKARPVLKNALAGSLGAVAGDFIGRNVGRGAVGELVGRGVAGSGVSTGVENSAQAVFEAGNGEVTGTRRFFSMIPLPTPACWARVWAVVFSGLRVRCRCTPDNRRRGSGLAPCRQ